MLADPAQLDRWKNLLDVPADVVFGGDAWQAKLMASQGRSFLTTAANVIAYDTKALHVLTLPPLATLPVRRPAVERDTVCHAVWLAYLHWLKGEPGAETWLRSFIDTLAPTALVFTADSNPEPWWQAEMIILHALHSFALRRRDRDLIDRTLACADFHLREIQPDHATNEPWAVHAYASHADGNVTAETLWHAAYIQHGGTPGLIARCLARDASDALAAYLAA